MVFSRSNCVVKYMLMYVIMAADVTRGAEYTAGVVEFAPDTLRATETPQELILRNTRRYVEIISTAAKHDVDILVFPECGLTSINIPVERKKILPFLTVIPDVGINCCDLPQAPQVLKLLSCAAKEHNIYVVVNLDELVHCLPSQQHCPSDGSLFFNTNIAFDRKGNIVAKYRKFNLFVEPEFNTTVTPDHTSFDTDFGVRFGMFICFDIMFEEPTLPLLTHHKISNFVYSTAWFSELPFLTAVSVQAAWAHAHDVNLLAAGYSNPQNKNTGSGIYAGTDGRLIALMSDHSSTKLLMARVSSDQRNVKSSQTEDIIFSKDTSTELNFFHDDLTHFTTTAIEGNTAQLEYENEGFSCNIHAEVSAIAANGSFYRLVAFSGMRTYSLVRTVHIEVCGIIACTGSNLSSCNQKTSFESENTVFSKISISASSNKQLVTYPITLDEHLLSFPSNTFQFKSENNLIDHKMSLDTKHSLSNFISFALFRNG